MLNKCQFIGNVGQKPEVRTAGQNPVANFSIACNEKWKDKSGQMQERTEWVRVTAWGKTAELCGQYLDKGRQVYVEGRMQTREYTDKNGDKKWTTEIVADRVLFLSKPNGAGGSSGSGSYGAPRGGAPSDEDVPF